MPTKIAIKAMKAKEVPYSKIKFPINAQLKLDGIRLITKIEENVPKFYTYNGHEVPLPLLANQIENARLGNLMLDGEYVYSSGKNGTRTVVSGAVNSAIHGGTIDESIFSYFVFDAMPLGDFNTSYCRQTYRYRYSVATEAVVRAGLTIARNVVVNNEAELEQLIAQLYVDGYEGAILKSDMHLYTFRRHRDWIKIKETKTADLKCVDTTDGTGKYSGMIGALICEGKVEGKRVTVKAGSGMNDADRARCPSDYVGQTIELKYNSVIRDSRTGAWSLFLPRFNGIRIDK